jgi:hypothetical protein
MQTPANSNLLASLASLVFLVSLVFFVSCGSQEGARSALPGKVGASGELVVVCDFNTWNGPVGDTLQSIFGVPMPVLPQYEPLFDLVHLPVEEFDRFWKPHRNIVVIDIADRVDTQEPSVKFYRDRYSSGQIFIEAKARSASALAAALHTRRAEMVSLLHAEEVNRFGDLIALDDNEVIARDLGQRHGVSIVAPRDARIVKENEELIWIDRQLTRMKGGENHDVQQGYVIYFEPYVSDTLFSMSARIDARNRFMRKYIPGPTEGSYMTSELRFFPSYEEVLHEKAFASELRGLWKIENDFMGGPFVSMTVYDEARARLVTVEGYVYAPYFDKREYIREVEAVVRSLVLLDKPA